MQSLHVKLILALLLFSSAFFVRVYKLNETPVYPDEVTWMVRAKETALAIRTLNFSYFDKVWWTIKDDTEAIAIPLTISTGFPLIYLGKDQSVLSSNILQDYMASRYSIAVFSGVFIVFYYFFLEKVLNQKTALISSLLLSFDPIFISSGRLVMNDIYLSAFCFLAIFPFVSFKNQKASILLTSFFAALSFLTKPNGVLIFLALLTPLLFTKHKEQEFLKPVYIVILFLTIIFLLWPAFWGNVFAVPEYLLRQNNLVKDGINNYFFGQITNNPPVYYYFFQIIWRIPVLVLASFFYAIYLIKQQKYLNKQKLIFAVSLIFMISFFVLISISSKKLGVRYALPLWPFIYLFAGWALAKTNKVIIITSVSVSFVLAVLFSPRHDLYCNVLAGGPQNAQNMDLVGLCSGSKEAVDYVKKCYPTANKLAVLGCGKNTLFYYYPHQITDNWKNEDILIIENHFIQLNKDTGVTEFYANNIPDKTIKVFGANLAYIYERGNLKNSCSK